MGNEGTTSLVLIAWPRIFLGDDHECGGGGCDWAKKCLPVLFRNTMVGGGDGGGDKSIGKCVGG